ncbi:MAG: hypothetical protein KY469_19245 [Actinobacteria bacterium]|nr:hypothetical protein [Actinomycetota bacterium]
MVRLRLRVAASCDQRELLSAVLRAHVLVAGGPQPLHDEAPVLRVPPFSRRTTVEGSLPGRLVPALVPEAPVGRVVVLHLVGRVFRSTRDGPLEVCQLDQRIDLSPALVLELAG